MATKLSPTQLAALDYMIAAKEANVRWYDDFANWAEDTFHLAEAVSYIEQAAEWAVENFNGLPFEEREALGIKGKEIVKGGARRQLTAKDLIAVREAQRKTK